MMTDQDLAQRMTIVLAQSLQWLNSLGAELGDVRLVDDCPNNWGGRVAIRETLAQDGADLKRLYDDLGHVFWWIENLQTNLGYGWVLMPHCPAGLAGMAGINEVLRQAERAHPELANLAPGTFITDGIIRGFVKVRTTMPYGRKRIPAYRIYTGSGVDSWIPCCQVRRI